jgi:ABC-type branched-subunit amino acid transport system ATPase component
VKDLRKSFGGVRAVRGVSFDVRVGETLGLIGPNGAGKTTTFELVAGFTRADQGSVRYAGKDITALGPEARGHLGLIRSFQDAGLFPTLTVLECVELALERVDPTRLVPSLLGLRGSERRKRKQAAELVAWMGLERYRSSQIQELSTGTRRITEIACLVALQPQLLLLDEPSSGVAQKETEALARLIVRLKAELGLTLVIIEHDIPLIMALADRIVCMADGEVIAAGTPEEVRHDPAVVEAYLGGSITAIERSTGAAPRGSEEKLAGAVPGLGASREAALLDAFGSVDGVRAADFEDLVQVRGIGPGMAARIQSSLNPALLSSGRNR